MSRGIEEDVHVFSWLQKLWLWFDVWMSSLSYTTTAHCKRSMLFGILLFDTSDDAHFQDLRWSVEEKKECLYMDTSDFVACREVACTCTTRLVFKVSVPWSTSLGLGCRMNYQCCKPHFWQKKYFTIRTNKQVKGKARRKYVVKCKGNIHMPY